MKTFLLVEDDENDVVKPNNPQRLQELAGLLNFYWLRWSFSPPVSDEFTHLNRFDSTSFLI